MATVDVKDAAGATVPIEKPLPPGSAAAASSKPVTLSTEDVAKLGALSETAPAIDTAPSGLNGRLQRIAQRITSFIALLPAALGQGTMSQSLRVVIASDQSAVPISGSGAVTSVTGTQSIVASAATDTTVLASNANRKGAAITNDDANILKLLVGSGTSSATVYTVQIPGGGGYYEIPFGYTGVIKGIWDADGTGAARVTEFT